MPAILSMTTSSRGPTTLSSSALTIGPADLPICRPPWRLRYLATYLWPRFRSVRIERHPFGAHADAGGWRRLLQFSFSQQARPWTKVIVTPAIRANRTLGHAG